MPSPRVLDLNPNPRTELTPLEQTLSAFSKQNKENRIEQQDTDALKDIYGEYQRDGKNIENAIINTQTKQGLSPTARVNAIKQLNEFQKHNTDVQAKAKVDLEKSEKLANNKAQLRATEERYQLPVGSGDAYVNNPNDFERINKPKTEKNPVKGAKEKYEEGLASAAAKETPNLEKSIAEGRDVLANLDTIEDIAKKELTGLKGYAKAVFNTESASQLSTLSATNLKSVIKLFNPVGALPTQKLNWIRGVFAMSPYDSLSTIQGKLNTQRIITNQALGREQERLRLIKKYYGNIPANIESEFNQESERLLDVLESQYGEKKEDTKQENKQEEQRPGFVKVKDPSGKEKWVPEDFAKQNGLI